MYNPKLHRIENFPVIENFIRKNSFASLISLHEGKHWATHLPLELELNNAGERVLWGHLSRANPQWKSLQNNEEVLAIFLGAHTYVSSSWYNHLNVPTWNYIAVHVYGKVKLVEGEQLHEHLKRLVNKYEVISQQPIHVETMPKDFIEKEMKGIVGLEITISKTEGKWKLSQNRDDEDFSNIIAELEKLNDYNAKAVAEEMKKIRS